MLSYFSRGFQEVGLLCCVALSKGKERQGHNTLPGPNVSILAPPCPAPWGPDRVSPLHQACVQGRHPVPLKGETSPASTFYSFFSLYLSLCLSLSVSLFSSSIPVPRDQPPSSLLPFSLNKLPIKALSAWPVSHLSWAPTCQGLSLTEPYQQIVQQFPVFKRRHQGPKWWILLQQMLAIGSYLASSFLKTQSLAEDPSAGFCCGIFAHCVKIYCCGQFNKELNNQ